MTTIAQTPAPPEPPTTSSLILRGVTWDDYEAMLRIVGDRPIRVTYDRGTMEVQMPSQRHEQFSHLLGRLVEEVAEGLGLNYQALGMTTWRRPDIDRGLEPDQCYYIRHEAIARRDDPINLEADPPPDLAIEVDITRNTLDRLVIYARLGIPEVWRHDGNALTIFLLQQDGSYTPSPMSAELHGLLAVDVVRLVGQGRTLPTSRWVAAIREFVAAELAPRHEERPEGAQQP
jgi:Uma2 family endonuclease